MGNFLKSIFPFPFREIEYQKVNLSKEESHKLIEQFMEDYGKDEKYNDNVDIPIKEEKINLGYGNYYQSESIKEWKAPTLDQLADYLEEEHKFGSDGKSMAIMSMVDFYRKNKDK